MLGPCRVILLSLETAVSSHGACLASLEAAIGLQRDLLVSIETCFQELAKRVLAMEIFLCLRTHRGRVLPMERSCSNFSWSDWMINISAVDPRV